ncbi:MAG: hypothetical protein KF773_08145 [Deltaproteobacteria bacterium]|nr:hypothetical protein [Deltaproteobacteria bacterium]
MNEVREVRDVSEVSAVDLDGGPRDEPPANPAERFASALASAVQIRSA